jgi:hypothetical protein
MGWTPALELSDAGGRCRLSLGGLARGEGETLQDAADELVWRLIELALLVRTGFPASRAFGRPELAQLDYVWQLGEMAARGEDIRGRVLGFD